MTRKQFLAGWAVRRRAFVDAEIRAGRMRPSEGVMTLADTRKDGLKLWRELRSSLLNTDPAEFFGARKAAAQALGNIDPDCGPV